MNGNVSEWLGAIEKLPAVHSRLRSIIIENMDAMQLIPREDTPNTLFYCLHPSCLIRTKDEQMVPIAEIKQGVCLVGNRKVTSVFSRHYDGPLLEVAITGLPDSLRLTPEHRVPRIPAHTYKRQDHRSAVQLWTAREEVQASQLRVGDYMLLPIGGDERQVDWQWNNESRTFGVRRVTTFNVGIELYRLLGYYAAEGHIQRTNGHATAMILSFNINEQFNWAEDAALCCESVFGFRPDVVPGPGVSVCQVKIFSTSVAEFVERFVIGRAATKFLAGPLLTAPIKLQRELLIGWMRGDGGLWLGKQNRVKLLGTSASNKLARQMFLLAMRCGLRPSFKTRKHTGGFTKSTAYDIYFAGEDTAALGWFTPCRRFCSSRRIVNGHILARIRTITKSAYNGQVYDLDVDDDNLFAAPFALVHNCDPPYLHETRTSDNEYAHEMTATQHQDLLAILLNCKGKVMLAGYRSELYDTALANWRRCEFDMPNHAAGGGSKRRMTECMWVNYEVATPSAAQPIPVEPHTEADPDAMLES